MSEENSRPYDKKKAREGETPRAKLLRAKDEILQFSIDDIHKALEGSLPREKYNQELMPIFLSYLEVTKKLDTDENNEDCLEEGLELLKKLQEKASELGISSVSSEETSAE